ncbi:MAG: hypothetical protein AB2610_20800 [Candidatus Thiodiazotropha sp.]
MKKHIRHEQYKEALFEKEAFLHGMDVLRSERHRIYGQHLNKVSFSSFASKRWIAKNGVDTLAYRHRDAVPADVKPARGCMLNLRNWSTPEDPIRW